MINEQVGKFLNKFMGFPPGQDPSDVFNPYGIFEWKEFMEKNHAELWNCYCNWCLNIEMEEGLPALVNCVLNPLNLATFLLEHKEEWEWVECEECGGHGTEICNNPDHGFIEAMQYNDIGRLGCPCCGHDVHGRIKNTVCDNCKGIGKIKHPAITWAEKEGL